jgi:hypothetical protein
MGRDAWVTRRSVVHWLGLGALGAGGSACAMAAPAPRSREAVIPGKRLIWPQRGTMPGHRLEPQEARARRSLPMASASAQAPRSAPVAVPAVSGLPTAYVLTAAQLGIPAWVLYGVALQESKLKFGNTTLPYPWTLGVRGRGERYASFHEAKAALERHLASGVRNIDCGAMQVNWHWHQDKLGDPARALDPYANLAVGAGILKAHFEARGRWDEAIGLYHTGSWATDALRRRGARYRASVARGLRAHGVALPLELSAPAGATRGGRDV